MRNALQIALAVASVPLVVEVGASAERSGAPLDRAVHVPCEVRSDEPKADILFADRIAWIPHVLFYPLYLATEYAVKRPLVALCRHVVGRGWDVELEDFLTWQGERSGVVPTVLYDANTIPTLGAYFWVGRGSPENRLRGSFEFWGSDVVHAVLRDSITLGPRFELTLAGTASHRPDYVYQGFGQGSLALDRSRFAWTRAEIAGRLRRGGWRSSSLEIELRLAENAFDADGFDMTSGDPSLASSIEQGHVVEPAGLDGYVAAAQSVTTVLDTRRSPRGAYSGVRVEAHGELGIDARHFPERAWVSYGAATAGYFDIWRERVVSLRLDAELADPLTSDDVPFTELPALSGPFVERSAGFLPRQLVGGSSAVVTLSYRCPLWPGLEAGVHASAGNVFDRQFSDFTLERARLFAGFDLQDTLHPEHSFRVAIAAGTTPLVTHARVDSVRFVVGVVTTP